ncbi:MAG: hypothetical protein WC658_04775 [Candidatus Omnitrophota bacterium]
MALKKCFALLMLSAFLLISGCETTKGALEGTGYTIDRAAKGAAKDTKNLAGAVMALDGWIKDNIW